MFEQILVTVDGSGRAREMTNMLLALPSLQSTQVNVLHVVAGSSTAEGITEYRLAGERILAKEASSFKLGSGHTSVSLLKEGDPKDVVCKVAEELKPSILVMGSRGMGRLQAILANSVSQYVFQLASVPMLLVKDDVYIKTIRTVMVSVDNSQAAKDALDFVTKLLAGAKDLEIILMRVVKKKDNFDASGDDALNEATAKLKRLNITYRVVIGAGDVGKEICKAAEENNASLLVIGSPDRRPSIARSLPDLDRLLGGSVSDYVRVNASCPVLLTRTPEA